MLFAVSIFTGKLKCLDTLVIALLHVGDGDIALEADSSGNGEMI